MFKGPALWAKSHSLGALDIAGPCACPESFLCSGLPVTSLRPHDSCPGHSGGPALWLPWLGSSASCPTMPGHPLSGVCGGSLPHSRVDNGACVLECFLSSPDLCTSHGRPHPCFRARQGVPRMASLPEDSLGESCSEPLGSSPFWTATATPQTQPFQLFPKQEKCRLLEETSCGRRHTPSLLPAHRGTTGPWDGPSPALHSFDYKDRTRVWPQRLSSASQTLAGVEVSAYSQRVLGRLPPLPVRAE